MHLVFKAANSTIPLTAARLRGDFSLLLPAVLPGPSVPPGQAQYVVIHPRIWTESIHGFWVLTFLQFYSWISLWGSQLLFLALSSILLLFLLARLQSSGTRDEFSNKRVTGLPVAVSAFQQWILLQPLLLDARQDFLLLTCAGFAWPLQPAAISLPVFILSLRSVVLFCFCQ